MLSKEEKDARMLGKVQRRLMGAFERLGSWRKVAGEMGINHGYVSMVMRVSEVDVAEGRVEMGRLIPSNVEVRKAMGFQKVLYTERKVRVKRVIPLMGSVGWERIFFKRLKARRWRGGKDEGERMIAARK